MYLTTTCQAGKEIKLASTYIYINCIDYIVKKKFNRDTLSDTCNLLLHDSTDESENGNKNNTHDDLLSITQLIQSDFSIFCRLKKLPYWNDHMEGIWNHESDVTGTLEVCSFPLKDMTDKLIQPAY